MSRAGYLARLARQSGAIIGKATAGEPRVGHDSAAPAGIEVFSERVVVPASTIPPSVAPPASPSMTPASAPVLSAPTPAPTITAPIAPEQTAAKPLALIEEPARAPDVREHPAIRVGDPRLPVAPVTRDPIDVTAVVAAAPEPEPTHPPSGSTPVASTLPAIDHTVFVVEERPGMSAAALPKQSASAPPSAPSTTAPRTTARFARALAEARSWVSATPAPGELPVHETSVKGPREPAFAPNEVVVKQDVIATPVAPLQELQVSIGKIEVVIEDAAPGTIALVPRMQTPASQAPAERAMRPLWRYHLRG